MINLVPHYRLAARSVMRRNARRLARGRGFDNRPLAPKARPDGRPLGGSVRQSLLRGRVVATNDGFTVDYGGIESVIRFDEGNPGRGQPARRVVGLNARDRAEILRGAQEEVVRQLNRGVR